MTTNLLPFPRSAESPAEERLARIKKALRIVDILDAWQFTSAEVLQFTKAQWGMAAMAAEVNPPSQLTQAAILQMLLARETAREMARKAAKL